MSNDLDLSHLLAPKSSVAQIGPEIGRVVRDGIAVYRSPHQSHRYVAYHDGRAVSVLQLVSTGRREAVVANVYTLPGFRRQGYASRILSRARRDFDEIHYGIVLSDDAKAWRAADDRRRAQRLARGD